MNSIINTQKTNKTQIQNLKKNIQLYKPKMKNFTSKHVKKEHLINYIIKKNN